MKNQECGTSKSDLFKEAHLRLVVRKKEKRKQSQTDNFLILRSMLYRCATAADQIYASDDFD